MQNIKKYIEAVTHLHTAKIKGYKAPHKAILLLSVIELVESGNVAYPQIVLTDELVEMFNTLWIGYLGDSTIFKADITKPYFHMQHETFWKLVGKYDVDAMMDADGESFESTKEKKILPSGYSLKSMRNAFEYAEIDEDLFELLQNKDARDMLREVIIDTYLSDQPTKTMPDLKTIISMILPLAAVVV